MQTPQTQAIALANDANALCQQLYAVVQSIQTLQSQLTLQGTPTVWIQFPTAALNPDGSLGTPDQSPVQTNPFNPALLPGINRAATYAQYESLAGLLNDFAEIIATGPNLAIMAPFLGD